MMSKLACHKAKGVLQGASTEFTEQEGQKLLPQQDGTGTEEPPMMPDPNTLRAALDESHESNNTEPHTPRLRDSARTTRPNTAWNQDETQAVSNEVEQPIKTATKRKQDADVDADACPNKATRIEQRKEAAMK